MYAFALIPDASGIKDPSGVERERKKEGEMGRGREREREKER